jgi:hypothetical protein
LTNLWVCGDAKCGVYCLDWGGTICRSSWPPRVVGTKVSKTTRISNNELSPPIVDAARQICTEYMPQAEKFSRRIGYLHFIKGMDIGFERLEDMRRNSSENVL